MSDNKTIRLLRLVDELSEAARRLGLEVRREKILREVGYRARGGACRFRDRNLIIFDREMAPAAIPERPALQSEGERNSGRSECRSPACSPRRYREFLR